MSNSYLKTLYIVACNIDKVQCKQELSFYLALFKVGKSKGIVDKDSLRVARVFANAMGTY